MKTGFFEERPGEQSAIRLMAFMVICIALIICLYQTYKTGTIDVAGFVTMAGIAFGSKVWQRSIENKENNKEENKQ